eukprot:GILK01008567.1.p1 GENE.GILK01008567.1~~GILK01008567.1.p1  ORF type:complete len:451 (-),score=70.41 GILK01008567.1:78-1313(-)
MAKLLGHPENQFKSIHVTGTNGKGSVVAKTSKALQLSGFKVGTFVSPHISCFRERIQIDQNMISEKQVETLLPEIFDTATRNDIPITFFEACTLLAFRHFAEQQIDWGVIEVGIGGRLDATNILTPRASVITSIGLDHTELLGDTLEKIAFEKAGIIKPGVPVILGPRTPHAYLKQLAESRNAAAIVVPPFKPSRSDKSESFDKENNRIAQAVLENLSDSNGPVEISESARIRGMDVRPPCRLEKVTVKPVNGLPTPPAVLLDVGHNPAALGRMFAEVRRQYPDNEYRLVMGMSKERDHKAALHVVAAHAHYLHLVEPKHHRAAPLNHLLQTTNEVINEQVPCPLALELPVKDGDVAATIQHALQLASEYQQVLVIGGSFFIMREARQALGMDEPRDDFDLNESFPELKKN